jgi:SPP1 family predicted phage head-tail adaptor
MRSGELDKEITIERASESIDDNGAVSSTWASIATLRAKVLQQSAEEFIRGFGASSETAIVFRTRYLAGLTLSDRIVYQGRAHDIKELKEIGRRVGWDIRCLATGAP